MAVWHKGFITQITEIAPLVRSFVLEVTGVETFDFLPGQFITLDLPISDKRQKRWRSYSIASAPNGTNTIELCISLNPEGLGTKWLFEEAKIGTEITFKGPDGAFTLPKQADLPLVMVCTGTGVAPFRSMLLAMLNGLVPQRPAHLIFGTRYASGILYRAEFERMTETLPGFRYDIALSREQMVGCHSGYVHGIYHKLYTPKQDALKFMLCGWTSMVDDAVAQLMMEMSYDRTQVIYELYG